MPVGKSKKSEEKNKSFYGVIRADFRAHFEMSFCPRSLAQRRPSTVYRQTKTSSAADTLMSPQAKLRIILQDHEIRKLDLPDGIPDTVDELESIVREKFGLDGNFTLHYKDADFGEEYFSLTSTSDIKDKDTIKVVNIVEPPTVTLTFTDGDSSFESASVASLPNSETSVHPASSSCSSGSQDTLILSSPEQVTHRTQCWPTTFPVPNFAYDTELVLASGNEVFKKDGIQLNFATILPDILEKLAESIFLYVAYPTSAQFNNVAEALIQKHPCLKEPGSYNGCYAWQQRLKYSIKWPAIDLN
uniref:sterile alpha motif domain-containing protein 3 isoform X3 n=1 Tax=Doryrhamphus excisus TaxID=161450 RepID=UPI0025AEB6EE|nr:sterile alpha motif domain-containing protein 3 isoform X3 [Doryrhamphus excisus]